MALKIVVGDPCRAAINTGVNASKMHWVSLHPNHVWTWLGSYVTVLLVEVRVYSEETAIPLPYPNSANNMIQSKPGCSYHNQAERGRRSAKQSYRKRVTEQNTAVMPIKNRNNLRLTGKTTVQLLAYWVGKGNPISIGHWRCMLRRMLMPGMTATCIFLHNLDISGCKMAGLSRL